MESDADPRLEQHRKLWQRKSGLRAVYADYHRRLVGAVGDAGKVLEIGSGSGHLRDVAPGIDSTTIDILPAPWVDVQADAHSLPFADNSFNGVVMLDVLHHLERPAAFFAETLRVLKPGGRIAMMEPGMSVLARQFYTYLHEEPVDMSADPLALDDADPERDPFDSNQAIPSLLFKNTVIRKQFEDRFPAFRIVENKWLSLFAYPLSGGFKNWSLVNGAMARTLIRIEDCVLPVLGPLMGFRLFTVLEKKA